MLYRIIGIIIALTLITLTVAPATAQGLLPPEEEGLPIGGGGVILPPTPMLVTTQGATSITGTSANLNGYLQSMGPYSIVDVWFETSDGRETTHRAMSSPGFYTTLLGQLEPGTSYQYRAKASSNLLGGQQSEGAFVSFTTSTQFRRPP